MPRAGWDALGYSGQNQVRLGTRPTENLCPSRAGNSHQVKYPGASKKSLDYMIRQLNPIYTG